MSSHAMPPPTVDDDDIDEATVDSPIERAVAPVPFGGSLEDGPVGDFATFIRSRYPLVFVDTIEEERAERLVVQAADRLQIPVFVWSETRGLIDSTGTAVDAKATGAETVLDAIERRAEPSVFVLLDYTEHLGGGRVCRRLKDFGRAHRHTVFLLDSAIDLPVELRSVAELYPLPRPDEALVARHTRAAIRQFVERDRCADQLSDDDFTALVRALRGLTLDEIDRVLARVVLADGCIDVSDVREALRIKTDLLSRSSALEVHTPTVTLDEVCGLDRFKRWAETRRAPFLGSVAGLERPRGFVLTGVPGCGKSLAVKALAGSWGVPLVRLDAGALMNKWIGETERRLRDALAAAEALAPCVLWIDEIEKGFAATGPSASDGGLGYRIVGTLATWMQERQGAVLLAATSNNVTLLPPELTRQGRFDETFFVDLPDHDQRTELLEQLLEARGCTRADFDLHALAELASGFSGSELEQAVVNGLYAASVEAGRLTHPMLEAELTATRPLSHVAREKIDAIRAWGATHARPA